MRPSALLGSGAFLQFGLGFYNYRNWTKSEFFYCDFLLPGLSLFLMEQTVE